MLNIQNIPSFRFPKQQRLTHKKRITELFADGVSAKAFPFRAKYLPNTLPHHRILIAVPKRNVGLATRRNSIKRLMREAFRLNQYRLDITHHNIDLLFIFNGKEKPSYLEVELKLIQLFDKIQLETMPKTN